MEKISSKSESDQMGSSQKDESLPSEEMAAEDMKKCCSDCKTTKTPLWRSGPSGPKSLCNACGIRYRKKRPTPAAGGGGGDQSGKCDVKKGKFGKTKNLKLRKALKVNLMTFGREVEEEEGHRLPMKRQRSGRQWGEVERAALLLMALSCGAVFA